MFKCPRCQQEYPSLLVLSRHTSKSYGLKGEALYREVHGITDTPTCKCGCGTPTKWRSDRGYAEYTSGHNAVGQSNPMAGKRHSLTSRQKISSERKRKFATGELTISSEVWSGAAKKVWERVGHKERMSKIRKDWITKNGFTTSSNLEELFRELANKKNVPLFHQYPLEGKFFDFWVQGTNILVELDGDFYHCNPNSPYSTPRYDIQKKNIENDRLKTMIAEKNGYLLLRFWETDINNNPELVIERLLAVINENTKWPK